MPASVNLPELSHRIRTRQASAEEFLTAFSLLQETGRRFDAVVLADAAMQMYGGNREIAIVLAEALEHVSTAQDADSLLATIPGDSSHIRKAYWKLHALFKQHHGEDASTPANECFLLSVVFKNLSARIKNSPMAQRGFLRLANHFGIKSAVECFGSPAHSSHFEERQSVQIVGGKEVRFLRSNAEVDHHMFYFFAFEPGMMRWIASFSAQDHFLDIGANIGKYSVVAAKTKGCQTYAIEPFPANTIALRENISINKLEELISIIPIAISDRKGAANLYFENNRAGAAHQNIDYDRSRDGNKTTVQTATVDGLIAEGCIKFPNHIKIDVDGNEYRLINGMTTSLKDARLKTIRIEIRPDSKQNLSALNQIRSSGFSCRIDDDFKNILCSR